MTIYDGFQCERLAAAILQEQGYVCEVCELRTHRYTAGDGGEQYQNRVDYFGEFDVIAIPTQDASVNVPLVSLVQVTRNQSKTEREEKMEGVADWADRHDPQASVEFWFWDGEAFLRWRYGAGDWSEPARLEPGDADRLLARHDERADQQVKE